MILYLFNNQLFEKQYLPKETKEIYLIEDPLFYGKGRKPSLQLKFNLLKLQYQRLALISYQNYLIKSGYKVTLFNQADVKGYPLKKEKEVNIFDPVDHLLMEKLTKSKTFKLNILDNPNFLLTNAQLTEYSKKSKSDRQLQHNFYTYVKKQVNILVGVKSYDDDNRSKLPKGLKLPPLTCHSPPVKDLESVTKYIDSTKYKYRTQEDQELIFPYTHKEAKEWLIRFLDQRFKDFGKYQDAISSKNSFIFHSCISPMVNLGLLQPDQIVTELKKYKSKVPINSFEGFVRQLLGWREYQRYIYLYQYQSPFPNYFSQKGTLSKHWYDATTNVAPVDAAIKTAFKYGYLHHIERLMVMGNFMTLCRIKPEEQYKWFMEFSLDSYDWVMYQNILMISYADGGYTMRKPYLSSSNYILKMSNYSKKESWTDLWSALFYLFLVDKEKELSKTVYIRNLSYWNKLKKADQEERTQMVKKYLNYLK